MKEIGEKLRNAREEIGISIEEASTDLKISKTQLSNLEDGNMDTFKDIINVKYLIRDYAKYLGLDKEDLVDDFNEYLFDVTSKDKKDGKDKKVKSPYTTIKVKKKVSVPLLIVVFIVIIGIASVTYHEITKTKKDNVISYLER